MVRAGLSAQHIMLKTLLDTCSSLNRKPVSSSCWHSFTNGFKNVFISGLLWPNHRPVSRTFFDRRWGGNSLTIHCIGHIEYLDDLKIGTPSAFHVMLMSLHDKWWCCISCLYSMDDVTSDIMLDWVMFSRLWFVSLAWISVSINKFFNCRWRGTYKKKLPFFIEFSPTNGSLQFWQSRLVRSFPK